MLVKSLAIIIPVINCFSYTIDLLGSIETKYPYKIILIDNGSTDETQDYFGEKDGIKDLIYFRFPENKGVAGSWNFGVYYATQKLRSEYFLILNNDIILHSQAIDILLEEIEEKQTLLVTGTDISGRISSSKEIEGLLPPVELVKTEAPEFSCFLIKKETIDKVGYFDEQFYPAYFEDNDYHYRIKIAGFKAYKINQALYFHYGSRTIKEEENIRTKANLGYLPNKDYYSRKWGGEPGKEKYKTPFNNQ